MLLIETCYCIENQVFGGVTTQDMSLTETCFYSRLYGTYISYYIADQQIHKGFSKKYILALLCSDNELYLRTVHLRTMMPVLAVMLLTNKAIQKRHSAADLIFSGQIYFYLITMGCILMGNIPNFCLSLTENLNVFFATLPFARQFVQCLHLHQGYCKIVLTKVGE